MILSSLWTSRMVHLSQMQTSRPGCGVTPPATATQRLVPSQLSSLFLGVFGSKFSPYSTFQLCCPPYLSPPLAAAPHSEPQLVLHTPNRVHPALQAWQKLTAPPPPGSLPWLNPLEGTSAPVTSACLSHFPHQWQQQLHEGYKCAQLSPTVFQVLSLYCYKNPMRLNSLPKVMQL